MTTKIIWGNFVQISQVPEISMVFLKETDFRAREKVNEIRYKIGKMSKKFQK